MSLLKRFEEFHEMASAAVGLDDFGDDTYKEPLKVYLADVDRANNFSELGRDIVTNMIVDLLRGRLMTFEGIKNYPDSQLTSIQKPIFIIGLARTGTTVLHRLISHDPNIQFLPFWLANTPMPRPPIDEWQSHHVFQQVKAGLKNLSMTMPGVQDIHPMLAGSADECRYLIDQSGWSHTLCGTADVPNYQQWVTNGDMTFAFEYYQKSLALIANGDDRRWVLKDVAHLFCLDAIFNVFPGACIVQTHRDPFDAMASTTNLTYLIRRLREPDLTMAEVGRQALKLWGDGLHKMELARRKYDESQFLDLHMLDIRHKPLQVLEKIYKYFDQPITPQTRQAWENQLSVDPNQAHGLSQFDKNDLGFTREDVTAVIGAYKERYQGVEV